MSRFVSSTRITFSLVLGSLALSAQALTFDVDTTSDTVDTNLGDGVCADAGGNCSLRAAVMESNASAGADTINLPAGTYNLTIASGSTDTDASIGDLDLSSGGVSFVGAGAGMTIIDASGITHRAFEATPDTGFFSGSISFSGLTIQGGNTSGFGTFNAGAAVNATSRFASLVSFNDVAVTGNTGASAINSRADISITNSTVSNNTGHGVFLTNDGANPGDNIKQLDVSASTFEGNGVNGIAIINSDGGTLSNSTVSGNGVHGLLVQFTGSSTFTVTNSTIAGNGSDGVAGIGFFFLSNLIYPDVELRNSVVADNTRSDVTTVALDANAGGVSSGGFNIFSDASASSFSQASDQDSTDPLLMAIALNAPGTTRTHAIPGNSPAIDMASAGFAPATDQRGVSRPQGAADDVGAYEFEPTVSALAVTKMANVAMASQGDPVIFTITITNNGPDNVIDATVSDMLGTDFTNGSWACVPTPPSTCTLTGSGDVDDTVTLVNGGMLVYTLNANVSMTAAVSATNTASITLPSGASDPNLGDNMDSATITIPNSPPVASDDSYTVDEDSQLVADDADGTATGGDSSDDGVLANDSDPDMNPLSVTSAGTFTATGLGGTVTLASDGTFSYDPPANAFGMDTFTYTVSDGNATDEGTVTLMVTAINDAPLFTAGPSQHFAGGTMGVQTVSNWVAGFDPGPNESAQSLLDYNVGITDADGVLNAADVLNDGTLSLDLTGTSGTAELDITAQDDGGTPGEDTSAVETVFVSVDTSADISLGAVQCTSLTGPGFLHFLQFIASNAGPDTASGVLVQAQLPAEMSFDSSVSATCMDDAGSVTCDLGAIDSGASASVVVLVTIDGGATDGPLATDATASALQPDASPNNNDATVTTTVVGSLIDVDSFESCGL